MFILLNFNMEFNNNLSFTVLTIGKSDAGV